MNDEGFGYGVVIGAVISSLAWGMVLIAVVNGVS